MMTLSRLTGICGLALCIVLDTSAVTQAPKGPPYMPAPDDILLYCSYDVSADADASGGDGKCLVQGKGAPEFVAGRQNRGALFQGQHTFSYPAQGNISEAGSIEMWIQPVDWSSEDAGGCGFFRWSPDPGNYLSLRVMNCGSRKDLNSLGVLAKDGTGRLLQYSSGIKLIPGRWYHVVVSWGHPEVALYVDGQPVFRKPISTALAPTGEITIGATHPGATIMDEVYVYRRPLSEAEVANSYNRYVPGQVLKEVPPIGMTILTWPYKNAIRLTTQYLYPSFAARTRSATLNIVSQEDVRLRYACPLGPDDLGSTYWFRHPDLPDGDYSLEIVLKDAEGGVIGTATGGAFTRKHYPWEHNRIGIGDDVIPPYQPIQTTDNVLSPLGRDYVIGKHGLPNSLYIKDRALGTREDIFSEPAALIGSVNGHDERLLGSGLQITSARAGRVELHSDGVMGPVHVAVDAFLEYDGWYQVKVKLVPSGAPVEIDQLTLLYSLWDGADTLYVHRNGDHKIANKYGAIPTGTGTVWESSAMLKLPPWVTLDVKRWGTFMPEVFVGSGDKGLWWYAESDRGWQQSAGVPCVQVVRDGRNRVLLRFNVVAEPVTLNGEREFEFALLASPAKPLPAGWRSLAWSYPEKQYVHDTHGVQMFGEGACSFVLRTEEDVRRFREFTFDPSRITYANSGGAHERNVHNAHAWQVHHSPGLLAGKPFVEYGSGRCHSLAAEEMDTFAGEWFLDNDYGPLPPDHPNVQHFLGRMNFGGTRTFDTPAKCTWDAVNWTDSFLDFHIYYHRKLVNQVGLNGTWWDNASVFVIEEYDEKSNRMVAKWNCFNRRRLCKRLNTMCFEAARPPLWLINYHADFSFNQILWMTENDFYIPRVGDTFLDQMSVDEFRALARSKGGVIPILYTYVPLSGSVATRYDQGQQVPVYLDSPRKASPEELRRAVRSIHGMCLLHDVGASGVVPEVPVASGSSETERERLLATLRDTVGFFESSPSRSPDFIPYWRQNILRCEASGVLASVYRDMRKSHDKQRILRNALIVLLNANNQDVVLDRIRIFPERLRHWGGGDAIRRVYDAESGEDLGRIWDADNKDKAALLPCDIHIKRHDYKLLAVE